MMLPEGPFGWGKIGLLILQKPDQRSREAIGSNGVQELLRRGTH